MPELKDIYAEFVKDKTSGAIDSSWEKLNSDLDTYIDHRKHGDSLKDELYKWQFLKRWFKKQFKTVDQLRSWINDKDSNNLLSRRSYGTWFEGVLTGDRGNDPAIANAFSAFNDIKQIETLRADPLFKWQNKHKREKTIPDRDAALYLFIQNPFIYMPYPPGVFKEAEKALFLKVMDIKYWMMLGHEVILKLMEQKFSTKINIDINFSVLDIDTEHENIKTGQYLCMLDVEDFIWITYYKNKYAKGDKMKGSFWTFKHKPGLGADADACAAQVDAALRNNCCMMQQEYVLQDSKSVTRSWNLAKKLNKGDIVFLRGDNRIYAVGEIIVPRGIEENEDAPCLKMQDITSTRSHGEDNQYRSDNFSGMIFFDDSDVFYEELEGKNGWGQRVDVDSWKYYCEDGIPISDSDFIKEDQYSIIRKMKPEIGIKLMEELKMASLSTPALLLHNQLNLILTGAPGTGKTYYAKKIAAELIGVNMAEETWQDMLANHPQYKFVQFHPGYDYSDFVEGLKPKLAGGMISFERKPGIFMEFCAAAAKDIDAPHVFVIDEINRADLSRVFGELFFGLEEDYRGNPISTQYSYLNDGQAFIIPSNAYIIGTMNDIDRSVESMDFALRRRFAWYEVTAEETAESILDKLSPTTKDKCMAAMNNLNKHIGSTFGDEYKLGAAYFKKIEKYGDDFSKLWKYHISIILADYLRGRKDRKDQFEKLGRIFSEAITDGTVPQGQAMP